MTDAERPRPPKKPRADVHGWLILDKPVGMTSTHAVAVAKRLFNAKKAGHAGTLDPLASGLLPIAFGEATKTVPFVMDGEKAYRFTVRWGEETDSDDAEGRITATSPARPTAEAIGAILPRFLGPIMQVPPRYSALKIDGERAYTLAREGEEVTLDAREVIVHRLELVEAAADEATFEAECGKGTYVRALARDFGRVLGCLGHVTQLRRTGVGPFDEDDAVPVADLEEAAAEEDPANGPAAYLRPVEAGLSALQEVAVSQQDAARLARGQSVLLRGRDAPPWEAGVYVTHKGRLVAFGAVEAGEFVPRRVFNFG
jgi:tRNA pseudouridine55 synthase